MRRSCDDVTSIFDTATNSGWQRRENDDEEAGGRQAAAAAAAGTRSA